MPSEEEKHDWFMSEGTQALMEWLAKEKVRAMDGLVGAGVKSSDGDVQGYAQRYRVVTNTLKKIRGDEK